MPKGKGGDDDAPPIKGAGGLYNTGEQKASPKGKGAEDDAPPIKGAGGLYNQHNNESVPKGKGAVDDAPVLNLKKETPDKTEEKKTAPGKASSLVIDPESIAAAIAPLKEMAEKILDGVKEHSGGNVASIGGGNAAQRRDVNTPS